MRSSAVLVPVLLLRTAATLAAAVPATTPLPLVIWHGLGDTYEAEGIRSVGALAQAVNPGTFVHYVYLDEDAASDRSASFFGLVDDQIAAVCEQLASVPELSNGFDALGFSQGGQFLRGYVERCNTPPVKTLITFGSQHNGIADFFGNCKSTDWVCRSASSLLRSSKWSSFVQQKVVPAQYFRDPEALDEYLENSAFLADINNERPGEQNELYKKNLASLDKFVMFMFTNDTTVIPKESAWWAEVNQTTGEVTALQDRPIYKEDWLGLKILGESGKLVFDTAEGPHMYLSDELLNTTFKRYLSVHSGSLDSAKSPISGTQLGGEL